MYLRYLYEQPCLRDPSSMCDEAQGVKVQDQASGGEEDKIYIDT